MGARLTQLEACCSGGNLPPGEFFTKGEFCSSCTAAEGTLNVERTVVNPADVVQQGEPTAVSAITKRETSRRASQSVTPTDKKQQVKEMVTEFTDAALQGIDCTLLRVLHGTSADYTDAKLVLAKDRHAVVVAPTNSNNGVFRKVPLHTTQVYSYDELQSVNDEDSALRASRPPCLDLVKPEERRLCVMIICNGEDLLTIILQDRRTQWLVLKSLQILISYAKHKTIEMIGAAQGA